ncbi:hypothetical protein KCU88_g5058, partial [Aureobasidium melanogenum]
MSNATYRFELAKTGRAKCQACKDARPKIEKGELRLGTLVNIQDHFTWKWKHWGCVTPAQVKNFQDQVGPLEDLDLDEDLPAILDGYDELPPEAQEKIKFALQHGHVADEDWKGDPELNRPGQKGIRKRTPKKKKNDAEGDGEAGADAEETPSKPKAKKTGTKKAKAGLEQDEDDLALSPPPKKKQRSRKGKTEDDEEDSEPAPPPKTSGTRKRKAADENIEAAEVPKVKKSRAKKVKAKEHEAAEDSDQALNEHKAKSSRKTTNPPAAGDSEEDAPRLEAQTDGPSDAPIVKPAVKVKRGRPTKAKQESADEGDLPLPSKSKKTKKVKVKHEDEGEDVLAQEPPSVTADLDDADLEEPQQKPKKVVKRATGKGRAKRNAA